MKQKRGSRFIKTYSPTASSKVLIWIMTIIIFAAHIPLINLVFSNNLPFIFFMLMFLIDGVVLRYAVLHSKQAFLNIYEDGLELERGNASFFVTWDNLSHFGRYGSSKNVQYGIYLFERVEPQVEGFLDRFLVFWSGTFLSLSGIIPIPTRMDGFFNGSSVDKDKLLETEFGQDLYHYAPQLFKPVEEKAKHGAY